MGLFKNKILLVLSLYYFCFSISNHILFYHNFWCALCCLYNFVTPFPSDYSGERVTELHSLLPSFLNFIPCLLPPWRWLCSFSLHHCTALSQLLFTHGLYGDNRGKEWYSVDWGVVVEPMCSWHVLTKMIVVVVVSILWTPDDHLSN